MRINKFVAGATGLSRRSADQAIAGGRVSINQRPARVSDQVSDSDEVRLDDHRLSFKTKYLTIAFNKPVGYVCSRAGQGNPTVYDLLPAEYQALKLVGRLDKDSSGLILLTSDGALALKLTHPRYAKTKVYRLSLDHALSPEHQQMIGRGLSLHDGRSQLGLKPLDKVGRRWQVTMHEGRNRQIRRTFAAVGYQVKQLQRTSFGPYALADLAVGTYRVLHSDVSAGEISRLS